MTIDFYFPFALVARHAIVIRWITAQKIPAHAHLEQFNGKQYQSGQLPLHYTSMQRQESERNDTVIHLWIDCYPFNSHLICIFSFSGLLGWNTHRMVSGQRSSPGSHVGSSRGSQRPSTWRTGGKLGDLCKSRSGSRSLSHHQDGQNLIPLNTSITTTRSLFQLHT